MVDNSDSDSDSNSDPNPDKAVTVFQCFPTKGRCKPDDHDWETDSNGQVTDNSTCLKCGYSFLAYIHMDMP